jgi:nucleotide-binding universal stress UspA family protein
MARPDPASESGDRRLIMITNCIIVGLDDSAASRAAHRWAAAYGYATGKDLRAVHVLDWPIGLNASAVKSGTRLCVPKQDIAEPYWRGMHRVFDDASSPAGSTLQFAQGDVGDVLVRLSTHADLLVVGTCEPVRGRRRYLAGSVSHYCISHASCPVVTVPEPWPNPQHDLLGHSTHHDDTAVAAAVKMPWAAVEDDRRPYTATPTNTHK